MATEMDLTPTAPIPDRASRLRKAKEVFLTVSKLGLAEREEALDRLCASDEPLRREVLLLLKGENLPLSVEKLGENLRAAHDALGTGADGGAVGGSGASSHGDRMEGSMIGRYRLLERLGEGGFGVVFMAEQTEPVRRTVALKILKLGMDTDQIVGRFEAERQALALMDHPNIARVLDAGSTETGRPYFVMELVKGEPITRFCDRNKLSVHDRLELFATVCEAVQHAHTKGVIHRDLKPGNVLVSFVDGKAVAKVIDFGIAKAIDRPLTEKAVFTEFRQLIGTPEYMSPEQADGSRDIDTRTDVYSLGVILYELLTGSTPFESTKLRSAAYGEIQRIIREVEPPRPSTRLSGSAETLTTVASARRIAPQQLAIMVKRELDWVVMKALDKDRSRRYESASGLMADVRRYVNGEAVEAVPPSVAYRARKFARKHRGPVIAAGLLLLSLTGGLAAALYQKGVAEHQRAEAVARKQEADARGEELNQVVAFIDQALGKTFSVFDTEVSKLHGSMKAREALATAMNDQAAKAPKVAAGSAALRRFKAATLERLGDVRAGTRGASKGDLAGALDAYKAALEVRRSLADEQPNSADALTDLSVVHRRLADLSTRMNQPDDARKELGEQRALLEKAVALGEAGRPARRILATMELQDARQLLDAGKLDEAEKGYAKARGMFQSLLDARPADIQPRRDIETVHLHLGDLAMASKKYDGALAEYEQTLSLARAIHKEEDNERHQRDVAVALYSVATALHAKGDAAAAKPVVDEAVKIARELKDAAAKAQAEPPDSRNERDLKLFTDLQGKVEASLGK